MPRESSWMVRIASSRPLLRLNRAHKPRLRHALYPLGETPRTRHILTTACATWFAFTSLKTSPGTVPVSLANQTAASFGISRSSRSWRFSRRGRRSSSRSVAVSPSSRRPRRDRLAPPNCESPAQSIRTLEPVPRACDPHAPAQPSGAGTPARRGGFDTWTPPSHSIQVSTETGQLQLVNNSR